MKKGFTLIELLVVIAIIAILAAILFPVFARAREKARATTCSSNQRQITASTMMYVQDHEETFPLVTNVWPALTLDPGVVICPTKGKNIVNGYIFNNAVCGTSLGDMPDPTTKWITTDGVTTSVPEMPNIGFLNMDVEYRHSGKAITSYADGHVDSTATVSVVNKNGPAADSLELLTPNEETNPVSVNLSNVGTLNFACWANNTSAVVPISPVQKATETTYTFGNITGTSDATLKFNDVWGLKTMGPFTWTGGTAATITPTIGVTATGNGNITFTVVPPPNSTLLKVYTRVGGFYPNAGYEPIFKVNAVLKDSGGATLYTKDYQTTKKYLHNVVDNLTFPIQCSGKPGSTLTFKLHVTNTIGGQSKFEIMAAAMSLL